MSSCLKATHKKEKQVAHFQEEEESILWSGETMLVQQG